MGDKVSKIKEALKALHAKQHYDDSALIYGKCISVNGVNSIDVDVDGITYDDVQLQAIADGSGKSLIIVPAKNSNVTIGNVECSTGYVLLNADIVDRILLKQADGIYIDVLKGGIKLNGDSEGGILIAEKLIDDLKKVNQILQPIMAILSGSPIPEPGNGSPSALQTALSAAIAGKQLPQYIELINDKVKHGK